MKPAAKVDRKTPPIQNLFTVKVPDLVYETTPATPPLILPEISVPVSFQCNILNVPSNATPLLKVPETKVDELSLRMNMACLSVSLFLPVCIP